MSQHFGCEKSKCQTLPFPNTLRQPPGAERTTNTIQLYFCIFYCRAVLRQVIVKLVVVTAAALQPQMADLPWCRFPAYTISPFLHCCLDIFSPFPVFNKSNGPVHEKGYGFLINCLITRSVQVELTYSMSVDSSMHRFLRFVS